MNGIDRLHGIAEDVGRTVWLRDLGAALSETADAIEGGTSDPSGYESDVLAWVEENGGLDAVRERLMPEGMEWPRYDSGEQVRIGETMFSERDGKPHKIARIAMMNSTYLMQDMLGDTIYQGAHGIQVKRHAVPAADGEPLEAGQTVWDTNGDELVIGAIEDGGHTVTCRYADVGDGIPVHGMWSPSDLTHRRPVLDADGVPIREGDTVWTTRDLSKFTVTNPNNGMFMSVSCKGEDGEDYCCYPTDITHTKPEPPDCAERIAEDIKRMAEEWCSYPTLREASEKAASSVGEATMGVALSNLSKRCRALAERERGE